MRHFGYVLLVLAAFGCKPRQWDEGGLLSDEPTAEEDVVRIAKGGDWDIACAPADASEGTLGVATYLLEVEGAVNAGDEAQELLVSVKKSYSGRQDVLVTKQLGHGAVSRQGPLFVGFTSGVLTGDPVEIAGKPVHAGVLTLAPGETEGLKVNCTVSKVTRG
jgi:hypothetical protein